MKSVLGICALFLAGCVMVKPVHLSDGSQGHSISCNGAVQSMAACMEKAGELCGSAGYTVVNQNGEATPFSQAQGGFQANRNTAGGAFTSTSGAIVTRNLLVRCGK